MRRILLGDIELDAVVDESPSITAEITERPVESGQDISDHMKTNGATISLSGIMVNDSASKLAKLREYQKDAVFLKYVGRNIFDNMLIKSLSTSHNKDTAQGYKYDLVLYQAQTGHIETFDIIVNNPVTKRPSTKTVARVKPVKNLGRKVIKKQKEDKDAVARAKAKEIVAQINKNKFNTKNPFDLLLKPKKSVMEL